MDHACYNRAITRTTKNIHTYRMGITMRMKRIVKRILSAAMAALLAVTPAVTANATAATVTPAAAANPNLVVSYLDVGQGDATVIQCGGQTMMIDGGRPAKSDYIYAWLKARGITHIDYMIGTHPDTDHVGGLSGALKYATVGTAYCSSTVDESKAFNNWATYLAKRGKTIQIPAAGTTFTLGGATVQILGPLANHESDNDNSIVTKVTYGATSFLFAGDAAGVEEAELVASGVDLTSTVLKVGHHGSDSSSTISFLNKVHPQYAVISVGAGNDYGHPTAAVLNRLSSMGISICRTDVQGEITAISNGAAVAFATQKVGDATALMTPGVPSTNTSGSTGSNDVLKGSVAGATTGAVTGNAGAASGSATQVAPNTSSTGSVTYVLNTRQTSHRFHLPTCQWVSEMSSKNRKDVNWTRDQVIAAGYKPCGTCNP